MKQFANLAEFYPYYLGEHRNAACRQLHLLGSTLVVSLVVLSLTTGPWWLILLLGPAGYGPAWAGHFFFERNRPATFRYPLYSLLCDWIMVKDMLTGRVPLTGDLPPSSYTLAEQAG